MARNIPNVSSLPASATYRCVGPEVIQIPQASFLSLFVQLLLLNLCRGSYGLLSRTHPIASTSISQRMAAMGRRQIGTTFPSQPTITRLSDDKTTANENGKHDNKGHGIPPRNIQAVGRSGIDGIVPMSITGIVIAAVISKIVRCCRRTSSSSSSSMIIGIGRQVLKVGRQGVRHVRGWCCGGMVKGCRMIFCGIRIQVIPLDESNISTQMSNESKREVIHINGW